MRARVSDVRHNWHLEARTGVARAKFKCAISKYLGAREGKRQIGHRKDCRTSE